MIRGIIIQDKLCCSTLDSIQGEYVLDEIRSPKVGAIGKLGTNKQQVQEFLHFCRDGWRKGVMK